MTTTTTDRNEEIAALYATGDYSFTELGSRFNLTRQRVRQIVISQGSVDGRELARARHRKRREEALERASERVQELAHEGMSVAEISSETGISQYGVQTILGQTVDPLERRRQASARGRSNTPRESDKDLLETLRSYIEKSGVPTIYAFAQWARENDKVGPQTYRHRFGSWRAAVQEAGGTPPPSRGGRERKSDEDVYAGVLRVAKKLKRLPSITEYERHRRSTDASATTARLRLSPGDWPALAERVMKDLGE